MGLSLNSNSRIVIRVFNIDSGLLERVEVILLPKSSSVENIVSSGRPIIEPTCCGVSYFIHIANELATSPIGLDLDLDLKSIFTPFFHFDMPPKKKPNEPSKKTDQKKKEKIIEVGFFSFILPIPLGLEYRSRSRTIYRPILAYYTQY